VLALPVLALTLGGILARPRGLSEWVYAVAGALAMVGLGLISPGDAGVALLAQWNVFLFFLGLMVIAGAADESGLVERLTVVAARAAFGRRDVLLVLVCGLAVLVTITLSNDATILVLTPLVVTMAARLGVPALPFAYACAYLANASSALLPAANPANVILLGAAPIRVLDYLGELAFPALAASVFTVAYLLVSFARELRGPVAVPIADRRDATASLVGAAIAATVVAYVVALDRGFPVGVVAITGAALVLAILRLRGALEAARVARDVEWSVFPFLAGLVVVVTAAENAGLVDAIAAALRELAAFGAAGLVMIGVATALAANVMNNLPAVLLIGSAVGRLAPRPDLPALVAAVLVGIDIGPNFTTIGSLATLMWILVLRRRGVVVTSGEYLKRSAFPSAAALLVALALVALRPR
jgi:arsenical pump membrane protein